MVFIFIKLIIIYLMNRSSEATSDGIYIKVLPEFVQEEDTPDGNRYLFSYTVEIINKGDEWAKLESRHWVIINADGIKEEVKGMGVVGYQPELQPGASFTYTSYCPLDTKWGTMEGAFYLKRKNGIVFPAEIKRFYLVTPDLLKNENDER